MNQHMKTLYVKLLQYLVYNPPMLYYTHTYSTEGDSSLSLVSLCNNRGRYHDIGSSFRVITHTSYTNTHTRSRLQLISYGRVMFICLSPTCSSQSKQQLLGIYHIWDFEGQWCHSTEPNDKLYVIIACFYETTEFSQRCVRTVYHSRGN